MDLTQTKLTKSEWNNTEIPIDEMDKFILDIIIQGYHDVNIRKNINKSMFEIVKIENNSENEIYLYQKYFENEIKEIIRKYGQDLSFDLKVKTNKKPRKVDIMRIENMNENIKNKKKDIFEFTLIDNCKNILKNISLRNNNHGIYLYTLIQINKSSIPYKNTYVNKFVDSVINFSNSYTNIQNIIYSAYEFIEKNPALLKYEDVTLFPHQKELFTIFKRNTPKLVLYIAPTGTGKTLSPIGLSESYKIIFICVSRHIGLALAKSAISMNKKIAFAFGCETASDIRLHNFAASEFTKNTKTGGIFKIDNSRGEKVEIMICDVKSYITAMHYMLAFNSEESIITYWDEPTITMDYEEHELHKDIHKNWNNNKISKVVLSCATLPKQEEIFDTIADFKCKFSNSTVHTINSYDFKKSISLLNKDCKCVLPHLLYSEYNDLFKCVRYCEENKTLLRYFDLLEIIRFVKYVNDFQHIESDYSINLYFKTISDITMNSLKIYYLECLKHINSSQWNDIYNHMKITQNYKFNEKDNQNLRRTRSVESSNLHSKTNTVFTKSNSVDSNINEINMPNRGLMLTTRDAYTLTDGPTIFMTNDVKKIGAFYIKYSNIPAAIFQHLIKKIASNSTIQEKMYKIQQKLDDKLNVNDDDDSKKEDKTRKQDRKIENDPEIRKLSSEIDALRSQINAVHLDKIYIPNTNEHQKSWTGEFSKNAFVPDINDIMVKKIMELDVLDTMKLLLLLGIGTFDNDNDIRYLEIMKELAYEQKLYIIIASTDYIYGTNYSFCHGYIGKDLTHMTQQKTLQAMGRVGRNKVQQDYTVRFRDDSMITKLFEPVQNNLEAFNMSRLFCSD